MIKLDDLKGKNVLITGAGKNIGRDIALEFAGQGANVYFTDIDNDRVIKLEEELKDFGVNYNGYALDVSKGVDNEELVKDLVKRGVNIDILVNNVGIWDENIKLSDFDPKSWRKIYDTNVIGPMYLTKLVFDKMMKENGGNIIFLSSIHQDHIRRFPSYSASKGALKMVVRELALELAPHKVRVNAIAPGYVELNEQGNPINHKDTPLHQTSINPKYIARNALVLASEYLSRHTTGSTVTVDGGLSLVNHLFYELPPGRNDDSKQ